MTKLHPCCLALLLSVAPACTPTSSAEAGERAKTQVAAPPSATTPAQVGSATPQRPDAAPTPTDPGPRVQIVAGGTRSVRGEHGVVVSVEKNATRAGVQMLEAGGNAVDAAIATAYALAVTHPSAGNIGGGGFALVKAPGQAAVFIDFRETAPAALDRDRFRKLIEARAQGPLAVGVPGTVAGLERARERFAKLPRKDLLAPAIALAKHGHRLGHRAGLTIGWGWGALRNDPAAKRIFGRGDAALKSGERLVQTDLAATLTAIADQGAAGFYAGRVAKRIEKATAGAMSLADLASYRAVERTPNAVSYRGLELEVAAPPSAGGVTLGLIVDQMRAMRAWQHPRDSADYLHLFLESSRRAQTRRRFAVQDPDTLPADAREQLLASWRDATTLLREHPILPNRATPSKQIHPLYEAALKELEHTTHLSVVDKDGMAVSITTTLSSGFGAKLVAPGTGVVLNNSVASFASMGDNVPVGGKRTTSSMSPAIVSQDGKLVAVLGSPGGDTIPSSVAQVFFNLSDGKMPLEDAVDAPRLHHGFVPDEVRYERRRPPPKAVLDALRMRGHQFSKKKIPIGDANNIVVVAGVAYGYADKREGGLALAAQNKR
jgi:gamma-glutamyltranspeptidase/glutathione hydrolase